MYIYDIVYQKIPKESTDKLLQLLRKFSKVTKISKHKIDFLYINKNQLETVKLQWKLAQE